MKSVAVPITLTIICMVIEYYSFFYVFVDNEISIRTLAVYFPIIEMANSVAEYSLYAFGVNEKYFNGILGILIMTAIIWSSNVILSEKIRSESFILRGRGAWYFAIFMFVIGMQYSFFSTVMEKYADIGNKTAGSFFQIIGGLIIVIGSMMLIYYFNSKLRSDYEKESAEIVIKTQKDYFYDLLEKENKTRQFRHDTIAQLVQLERFLGMNEADKALEFVDQMLNDISGISNSCYDVGNDIINTMLDFYLKPVRQYVSVKGFISDKTVCSDTDLCIITSNIFKNAVEAIENVPEEEKRIDVDITAGKLVWRIIVRNSTVNKQIRRTTKADTVNHGFGIMHVRDTVGKYNGKFKIQNENGIFVAEVIIPNE